MWTDEQKRAIDESGNLLVSAAAGAGKTAVLTERIVRMICEGAEMDELLIVTFTRLAAAEMKERIENKLTELSKKTDDAQLRRRLETAASSVFRANISTIDVFCRNVLKRNYHKVGLDPAFRTADDAEAEVLMEAVLAEVLENFYLCAEREKDDAPLFLIEALDSEENLAALIKNIHRFINARPDPLGWLSRCAEKYAVGEGFDKAFALSSERFISLARRNINVFYQHAKEVSEYLLGMDGGEKLYAAVHRDMEELLSISECADYEAWHNALSGYKPGNLPKTPGGAPEEVKKYREELKKFISKLKEMFALSKKEEETIASCLHPVILNIIELVKDFSDGFTAAKRENSLVDFADMEQLCLLALSDDEVAEEYRQKFSHIFIDEYQDTNSVQDSIFKRISRGDNLFMVGDVKQSIYRFRQAEPEIFLEKYRSYDGKIGTRIDLNKNFRSNTAVLNATNRVFYSLMKGETGEIDYSDNAELCPRDDAEMGSVELDLIELSEQLYKNVDKSVENMDNSSHITAFDEDNSAKDGTEEDESTASERLEELENVESEADFIADKILYMMKEGEVYDKLMKAKRKPRFSDFAVLMRVTRGFALRLVNALNKRGIPSSAELGDGYFDAVEVQIFINLLRIIDNLRQDIPLASVLLSPIGGFTEGELALVKSEFRGEEFRDAPFVERLLAARSAYEEAAGGEGILNEEKAAVFKKAAEFIEKVLEYRELARLMEVSELLSRLFDETRFALFAGALPSGEVRRANLDMLFERAASFESIGGRSLHGFVNYLDSLRENSRLGAAQVPGDDAVRVMSIHKSKGLEFPVVFVCTLTSRFNNRDMTAPAILDRDLGMGLRVNKGFYRLTSLPPELSKMAGRSLVRRAIEAREQEKLVSEEMRVLYVAMTRAQERLFLVGAHKKMAEFIEKNARELTDARVMGAKNYLEWLLGALFPLGLNLENAMDGVSIPVFGDSLTAFYRMAGQGDAVDRRIKKPEFELWLKNAESAEHSDIDARLGFVYPYIKETETAAKRGVTESALTAQELTYEPAVPLFVLEREGRKLSGAERGTLTHRFIMLLPIEKMSGEVLEKRLEFYEAQGFFTHDEACAVDIKRVLDLTSSPIYSRLIAAKEAGSTVLREQEFSLLEEDGVLTQGVIDCCFEEQDGFVIVDYKTTALRGRSAQETAFSYKPQLDAYEKALESLTGKGVKEKHIFLLSTGEAVRVN
ncbi:MAG: helicase-exonuclease AddAB subunit AddA [Clostridia bacterium]|nr:helicase-exonuclease AddAB subunit AddA [Clostridia bacterium]